MSGYQVASTRHYYANMNVTGGVFKQNGITSMPKSVPCLMLDKVRRLFLSEMFCSSNFDFACAGERERNNLMRSGL